MASLSIGALSKAADTQVETIRYYERIGLLPRAARDHARQRDYDATILSWIEFLQRLVFVRRSRDLGFTIEQVRGLLTLADEKNRPCADVDRIAMEHVEEIERKIADLAALGQELKALLACCGRGTISDCRIIEALAPESVGP